MLAAIVINIDPILIQLGPLAIRWYGLMYVVGIVLGVRAALPFLVSKGISEDQVWNVLGPGIVAGLIGGRLFYVVQQPLGPFIAQPWRILATWEGGMAFYGAVFGGILALVVMAWRERIPFWWLLDGATIFAAVGQFFGRIGNVVNGDILGRPTTQPWGFIYANPNSFAASHTIPYEPAAIYEMIANLVIIGLLFFLRNRVKTAGVIAGTYLLAYSVSQYFLFFLRDTEPTVDFGLKQAQLTSIVVFVVAIAVLAYRLRSGDRSGASTPSPASPVGDTR
ncbi:MAG TPA: prolipoprotein diacylglyceryl transferase [Chloroflexota bacterium]|nr:prolipoprotein diacylglyceryl transferase [Chloroflexota bacterium]